MLEILLTEKLTASLQWNLSNIVYVSSDFKIAYL